MIRQKIYIAMISIFLFLAFTVPNALASGFYISDPPQGGRNLTADDWVAHLPLLIIVTLVVIVIDAFVIGFIMRNRRRNKNAVQ